MGSDQVVDEEQLVDHQLWCILGPVCLKEVEICHS